MTTRAPTEYNDVDGEQRDEVDGHGSMGSIEAGESDSRPAEKNRSVDVPPDGGYGWVCTGCVAIINGHTWGVNSVSRLH